MNEKNAKIYHAFHDWKRARCWFDSRVSTEINALLDDFNSYMHQFGLELSASIRVFEQLLMSSYFEKFEANGDTYWNGISTVKRDM